MGIYSHGIGWGSGNGKLLRGGVLLSKLAQQELCWRQVGVIIYPRRSDQGGRFWYSDSVEFLLKLEKMGHGQSPTSHLVQRRTQRSLTRVRSRKESFVRKKKKKELFGEPQGQTSLAQHFWTPWLLEKGHVWEWNYRALRTTILGTTGDPHLEEPVTCGSCCPGEVSLSSWMAVTVRQRSPQFNWSLRGVVRKSTQTARISFLP